MPRFTFNLQPVLEHRERIEQERLLHFATAMQRLREEEQSRDDLLRRRNDLRERLRTDHHAMDVEELRAAYAHSDYLNRAIVAAELAVDAARAAAEVERGRLIEATKDKKVLETLKTRRREAFEAEAAAAEQRELDDLNARLFERTRSLRESTV